VIRGSNPAAGAWVAAKETPQPTMPPLIFSLIVRVACDAPIIVRVAHGWGGWVEINKNNPIFSGDGRRPVKPSNSV
jgi:hypothetical protein